MNWEEIFKKRFADIFPKHIRVDGVRYTSWAYGISGGGYKAGYFVVDQDAHLLDNTGKPYDLINVSSDFEFDCYAKVSHIMDVIGSRTKIEILDTIEASTEVEVDEKENSFANELKNLINRYGKDAECNIEDYILADYLIECIKSLKHMMGKKYGNNMSHLQETSI